MGLHALTAQLACPGLCCHLCQFQVKWLPVARMGLHVLTAQLACPGLCCHLRECQVTGCSHRRACPDRSARLICELG